MLRRSESQTPEIVLVSDNVLILELNLQHLPLMQIIYYMPSCDKYSTMKNSKMWRCAVLFDNAEVGF